jgi:hypothetical protein
LISLLQEESSDVQKIDELLDVLIDSKEPFKEKQLGGGPWQVKPFLPQDAAILRLVSHST